jgi:hypothetical protein
LTQASSGKVFRPKPAIVSELAFRSGILNALAECDELLHGVPQVSTFLRI